MRPIALFTFLLIIAPCVRGAIDEVPLQLTENGHFSLDAVFNGKKGRFIIDTGSTGSIVGLSKLDYFNIKRTNNTIDGITIGDEDRGKIETFPINIESFVIGNHELTLKNIYSNSILHLGPKIDGIIGHDAIDALHGLIDIKKSMFLLPESDDDVKTFITDYYSEYTAVPLLLSEVGFTLVRAKFEQHNVVMLVDSGAQQVVLDTSVVADDLGFELENHPQAKSVAQDGTETPMKVIQNKTLKIGSAEIEDDFLTTDFGALKQALGSKYGIFIGVIGNKELAFINAIIDAANSTIYVRN